MGHFADVVTDCKQTCLWHLNLQGTTLVPPQISAAFLLFSSFGKCVLMFYMTLDLLTVYVHCPASVTRFGDTLCDEGLACQHLLKWTWHFGAEEIPLLSLNSCFRATVTLSCIPVKYQWYYSVFTDFRVTVQVLSCVAVHLLAYRLNGDKFMPTHRCFWSCHWANEIKHIFPSFQCCSGNFGWGFLSTGRILIGEFPWRWESGVIWFVLFH